MAIEQTTSLDYLINDLRFQIGDTSTPYDYEDADLRHALVMGIKTLMKKWKNRYTINANYVVSRNSGATFDESAPPVIERADEPIIILQSAIIIKTADLQGSVWDIVSWRDDEVSYSNLTGGGIAEKALVRDMDTLERLLKRRLYGANRQSLAGFKYPYNVREG